MTNRVAALTAYVACIVAANLLTNAYGLIPMGFGLVATAGTYAAGLALLARDWVQDAAGRWAAIAAILAGAAISALFSPALALASGVAFLLAELADMAVYTPLRSKGWGRAAAASGVVGAVVDTLVFLWIAGFPIALAFPGQMVGKVLWATLVPVLLVVVVRRAVSRPSIG